MTLKVAQESHYKGVSRWKWSVWIEGSAAELDEVQFVTYFLHPTFSNPIRIVSDRSTKFRLESSGWGEFDLKVDIRLRNEVLLKRKHHLVLEFPPDGAPLAKSSARTQAKHAPRRAPEKNRADHPYSVFISHSAIDRPLVNELANYLKANDVSVFDDSDVDPGLPFRLAVEQAMATADATVVILSDFESDLIQSEVDTARGLGMPVFPVAIGGSLIQASFAGDIHPFRVDSPADMPYVAGRIAEHLRGITR